MRGIATACDSDLAQWVQTLGSVAVGALLAFAGTYFLWLRQRAWQQGQVRFERQLEIVRTLDHALVEAERRIYNKDEPPEGESRWDAANREWGNGWVRASPFLNNHDLSKRYESVGLLLAELPLLEAEQGKRLPGMRRAARQALQNARIGIAYFAREEKLPPPCFPDPEDLRRLLGEGDPNPLGPASPLIEWLKRNPVPPWLPKRDHG